MGQKVNPKSIRLKISQFWSSKWFEKNRYTDSLIADLKVRRFLSEKLKSAAVAEVVISRDSNKVVIDIHSGRPGVIIGRGGSGSEELKKALSRIIEGKVQINIIEVKRSDANAAIIAQNIASQIEKRIPFRRAIKQSLDKAKEAGAKGVKIHLAGRLNGVDIARNEKGGFGTVPLSTFKSEVDYAYATALTTFGIIGIKVWVYNSENQTSNIKNQNDRSKTDKY